MVCERTPRYHQRAPSRPLLVGEPVISIPCFINGCHWTALTHRKVDDQVVFLYSDDLGDPHTEAMEKHHLSLCDERFYPPPPSAHWIYCKTPSFHLHSNECGIRTLLALMVQGLHPTPSPNILLPFLHPNLALIRRTWIAALLLGSNIQEQCWFPLLQQDINFSLFPSTISASHAYLIDWHSTEGLSPEDELGVAKVPRLNPLAQPFVPASQFLDKAITISRVPHSSYTSSPIDPSTISPELSINKPAQDSANHLHISSCPAIENISISRQAQEFGIQLHVPSLPSKANKKNFKAKPLPKQLTLHSFLSSSLPLLTLLVDDLDTWGHVMDDIDMSTTLRIILQNPNGIQPSRKDVQFSVQFV
jgi:hypothetical protein